MKKELSDNQVALKEALKVLFGNVKTICAFRSNLKPLTFPTEIPSILVNLPVCGFPELNYDVFIPLPCEGVGFMETYDEIRKSVGYLDLKAGLVFMKEEEGVSYGDMNYSPDNPDYCSEREYIQETLNPFAQ